LPESRADSRYLVASLLGTAIKKGATVVRNEGLFFHDFHLNARFSEDAHEHGKIDVRSTGFGGVYNVCFGASDAAG
jgi:hypothetical protein